MRIAIVGTRGIPAAYGGFETLAWELSIRLARRGHQVTVYCRRGRTDESIAVPDGVQRRFLPYLPGKYPETVSHTGLSVLDGLFRGYDAMWVGNVANAVCCAIPRLRGTKVVLNVDGIERQRAKWGPVGRAWYAVGERFALVYPNAIVADADVIRDYYRDRYGKPSTVILYGAPILDRDPAPDLTRHGIDPDVEPGRFLLYVSRLEPENQADLVIRAYRDVPGDLPLLIVGDAPYADAFKARLRELAAGDPRVRLTGAIYGDGYRDLQRSALAYIQATSVGRHAPGARGGDGGRQPRPRLRHAGEPRGPGGDRPAVRLGGAAHVPAGRRRRHVPTAGCSGRFARGARARAASVYSWDAVTDAYLALWASLGAGTA